MLEPAVLDAITKPYSKYILVSVDAKGTIKHYCGDGNLEKATRLRDLVKFQKRASSNKNSYTRRGDLTNILKSVFNTLNLSNVKNNPKITARIMLAETEALIRTELTTKTVDSYFCEILGRKTTTIPIDVVDYFYDTRKLLPENWYIVDTVSKEYTSVHDLYPEGHEYVVTYVLGSHVTPMDLLI